MDLASLNCRSENVIVEAIIIPELELCNVKMQVFLADIVECADDPALNDAPKALDCVGVDSADNVLALRMVDGGVRIGLAEAVIANPLIGAEQADLVRDCFIDESLQRRSADIGDDASDHVALAANCPSDDGLARTSWAGNAIALIGVTVLGPAADECFINFNDGG
jgi:hypothetical protein